MPDPKKQKVLSEDEREMIVRLRLNAVPVRQVAQQVGCNKDTVTKHFNAWLDETSAERRDAMERERSRVLTRLHLIANEARRQAVRVQATQPDDTMSRADLWTGEARFMHTERQAMRDLSTIAGYAAPQTFHLTGGVDLMSKEEAAAALAKLPD